MDDLKYNTQGPFTSEHEIFHASSRSSSYDREVKETTSSLEKKGLCFKLNTEEDTESQDS